MKRKGILLLAQRLTAARHGYSFSRVFRSLITSTCRSEHTDKPRLSTLFYLFYSTQDARILLTFTGLFSNSSWTYSATRGAAIRSGSEPPMSR